MRKVFILTILIIFIVAIVGSFFFFTEKCSENQLFNPYTEKCVGKTVLCNLDADCALLEGQTASFTGENLIFTLTSIEDRNIALVNINGLGEARINIRNDFTFDKYKILFESADGDENKIMGADFEVTKLQ